MAGPEGVIGMGEIAGAGLLAHVPTIMLPEPERRELNHGHPHLRAGGSSPMGTDDLAGQN